jgi:hypothetical protein
MEIDIGNFNDLDDLDPIKMNFGDNDSQYNFDSGVELLMNDKKINPPTKLSNLEDLENELNNLANPSSSSSSSSSKPVSGFGNWFNFSGSKGKDITLEETNSNIGHATKESLGGTTKTWDGFTKVNEVPSMKNVSVQPNMTERDRRRKKKTMINKLEEWYERGHIKNNPSFNMDSPYDEVEDEYETAVEDKRKKDSLKLQSWWLKTMVNSIEFANSTFDPFGLDISGFGEQVEEDMDSYEEVFGELYDKYKGGKLAPEISILLKLGITAATVNITNRALSSATPGFRDVIKQSPELMKVFTNATVDAMNQNNPGFSFASNLMNKPEQVNTQYGPPPAPVETKNQAPPRRPGTMEFTERPNPQRPDINQARGSMFKEQGVELNGYQSTRQQEMERDERQERSMRPEMKGPSEDIDNFLSGLKPNRQPTFDEDSMISISSLKELQNSKMPRTTKKRGKSEKNIIQMDI